MGSFLHFEVTGESPYPQKSGIFEVEVSITDKKPSSSEIENKSFSSIWKGNFHLNVKNGFFVETLGSETNPLPESITSFTNLWIVVTDQFAPIGSLFEFEVPSSMKSETPSTTKSSHKPKTTKRIGLTGDKGPPGEQGDRGDKGVSGDKGDKGPSGDKGSEGEKGVTGDKGDKGDKGSPGPTGIKGDKGDKGLTGDKGDKGEQGERGLKGGKGETGQQGPPLSLIHI